MTLFYGLSSCLFYYFSAVTAKMTKEATEIAINFLHLILKGEPVLCLADVATTIQITAIGF